ncbi:HPP family protein [Undibacterium oligocarboniphilum]|uniref:HPP family protein n=1 Tax=Undibacterium oligocarboniphilum TaxID=666702 RepID=A0A850QCA4_9BURK|nr:HPP family protein [Undibacterium oligocarboniphilum]MBC3868909.1 HPP family protein [Undibacterium oligocarboniphilum]NVO76889.1 HPP family protein [Undibacterium oligocarboniphilum]
MRRKWSLIEDFISWLKTFLPAQLHVDYTERLRACGGIAGGLLLTGLSTRLMLGPVEHIPMLIGPIGASAVLLFGVPASPLAQPWSIIGGNLISALIGVTCVHFFGVSLLSAAIASAAAVAAMFFMRCLHPPGGAVALTAVLGGPVIHELGYQFPVFPVLINSLLLMLFALAYNNVTGRRYPHASHPDHSGKHGTRDARPIDRLGFKSSDLDEVLQQYNQVLDVSRDDLEALFQQTEMHAYRRRFGEISCGDVMSRDVVTAEFGTTLEEAWGLLRQHRIKALPVTDRARRVIGIVTLVDFMKHANLDVYEKFDEKLRQLIRRARDMHSNKPEVVGQIMTKPVRTAIEDMHIVELVPLLSDQGLHHIPIVDHEHRLTGMLTQSDLIAALYRGRLGDTDSALSGTVST